MACPIPPDIEPWSSLLRSHFLATGLAQASSSPGHSPAPPLCPVPSCLDHSPPSHDWASFSSMRPHVDAHLAGQLSGDWLRGQGFSSCEVSQRVLSLRFCGRCPSCFRTLVARLVSTSLSSRPLAEGAPGVWDVFVSDRRVRSSVPKGARDAWCRCHISALADIVAHRDVKSWTDFLSSPALVLPAPSRGGRWVRCVADVWTGKEAFGPISVPRWLPGR